MFLMKMQTYFRLIYSFSMCVFWIHSAMVRFKPAGTVPAEISIPAVTLYVYRVSSGLLSISVYINSFKLDGIDSNSMDSSLAVVWRKYIPLFSDKKRRKKLFLNYIYWKKGGEKEGEKRRKRGGKRKEKIGFKLYILKKKKKKKKKQKKNLKKKKKKPSPTV